MIVGLFFFSFILKNSSLFLTSLILHSEHCVFSCINSALTLSVNSFFVVVLFFVGEPHLENKNDEWREIDDVAIKFGAGNATGDVFDTPVCENVIYRLDWGS